MVRRRHLLKRTAKLLISMGFYGGECLRNLVLRLGGGQPRFGCVVLYYHAVRAEERLRFAKQMDVLLRLTKPIRVDTFLPLEPRTRYSAVTFDDAFENVLENAVPELRTRNIPATLFVTTDVMGKPAEWWPEASPERQERIASAEQIQQLTSELISIGSHTLAHPMLPSLNEAEAKREIGGSREKLEYLLGRRVNTFSFPFGAFNGELAQWCREAGYARIFTSLPERAFQSPVEFIVGRVPAEPSDWSLEFRLKLLGAYCWLPHAFSLKRRMLSNSLVTRLRSLGTPTARKSIHDTFARNQSEN